MHNPDLNYALALMLQRDALARADHRREVRAATDHARTSGHALTGRVARLRARALLRRLAEAA